MQPHEIRELVEEAVRAHSGEHRFRKRAPLSKFTDEDGKTWYSSVISRVNALGAVLALFAAIFSGVWASMGARDRLVVYPHVEEMIDAKVGVHEVQARREMEQLSPQLARVSEMAELRQALAVAIAQQAAIKEQLDRMEARMVRAGR